MQGPPGPEGRSGDLTLTYEQGLALIEGLGSDGEAWPRHCRSVSDVACTIASALSERGVQVEVERARVLGLTHDIGRSRTHHPVLHGFEGYKMMTEMGHPDIADFCMAHVFCGISLLSGRNLGLHDLGLPQRDFIPQGLEEHIALVADTLADDEKITSFEDRFGSLKQRVAPEFLPYVDETERRVWRFRRELESMGDFDAFDLVRSAHQG
jgi:hypothetical protein